MKLVDQNNQWTKANFDKMLRAINKTGELVTPEGLYQLLLAADGATYSLTHPETGEWHGVTFLAPLTPGDSGLVHIYLWSTLYMRRPAVLKAILRDMFRRFDLHRIATLNRPGNPKAGKLAKTLGFVLEGEMREAILYNGTERHNLLMWGLLRSEV